MISGMMMRNAKQLQPFPAAPTVATQQWDSPSAAQKDELDLLGSWSAGRTSCFSCWVSFVILQRLSCKTTFSTINNVFCDFRLVFSCTSSSTLA